MRGREFLMKDLYSFCRTAEEHAAFYEKAKQAYVDIFKRIGLAIVPMLPSRREGRSANTATNSRR